jgi:signal transduction histidine kinase
VPERGRSVVKRHGGTVTFETETGKGTTFIIRLPIAGQRGEPQNKEAQK